MEDNYVYNEINSSAFGELERSSNYVTRNKGKYENSETVSIHKKMTLLYR